MQYLSQFPQALVEVLLTGGLPPGMDLPCSAEEVYSRLFRCAAALQRLTAQLHGASPCICLPGRQQ